MKFSRLARRGILLGLSLPQVATTGVAVATVVVSLYLGGGRGLAWTSPLWVAAIAVTWVRVGGRTLIEWAPITIHWAGRVVMHQTVYRRRITKPRPVGTLALPGDAAAFREYVDPDSGAVMVHDPHHHRLIALLEVTHPAYVLLDPSEQHRRVAAWGHVLSTVCRSSRIARLQVLERTLPDAGTGLAQWWNTHGIDDGSWVSRTYRELIDRAGPAGERHITTISIALDMTAAARAIRAAGRGLRGAAAVLRQDMATLTAALRAAELTPSTWYTPGQLALVLRGAYDPAITATLERTHLGQHLATAGPVAITESWNQLQSDSAHHAVLWISEWPRSPVYPGFLDPVLTIPGVQRAITLLYQPVPADAAARDLRRKKTEHLSDAAQRARIGQLDDPAHTAEYHDVVQQEADLTAGYGVLRHTGLITISAPTPDHLDTAVAAIEQTAIQASCETRRLVGQQAQAFTAAAIPLCRGV